MSIQILQFNFTTMMIGSIACIAVCLILLLIFRFGIREKSFEEVIAEQNKLTLQEQLQLKQEKVKKEKEKKQKHKKWGKRKEKGDQTTGSVKAFEAAQGANVESETGDEIEIVEPKEIVVPKKKQSKTTQKLNVDMSTQLTVKPIETEAPKHVADTNQPKKVEKKEKGGNVAAANAPTKDKEKLNVDLAQSQRNREENSEEKTPEAGVPVQAVVSAGSSSAAVNKKKREKKVEQPIKGEMTATRLISLIKETALGDEESQMLIDLLLNKQKDDSGWKKVNDPQTIAVKKQLQEKDMLLEQEHRTNQANTQKLKQELTQEKTKATTVERMLQEKIVTLQHEIQAYQVRIKQGQDSQAAEKTAAKDKIQQLEKSLEERTDTITKFQEEKAQLNKTIKKLESESRTQNNTVELEALKKSRDDLQKVHTLLVEEHTLRVSSHKTEMKNMNAKLDDAKKELQKATDKNGSLLKEVESLKQKYNALEQTKQTLEKEVKGAGDLNSETKRLQEQLKEATKRCQEVEAQIKTLVEKNSEMAKDINQLTVEIEKLQVENERLSAELAATNERVAGDGQEMLQQNGEVVNNKQVELEKFAGEQEQMLKEKESVLRQLYDDISTYKGKIETLSNEVEIQKQKNNELREKNWKAMDALKTAEQAAEQRVKDAEEKIREIRQDAEAKLKQLQDTAATGGVQDSPELLQKISQYEKDILNLQQESKNRLQQYDLEVEKNTRLLSDFQKLQLSQTSSDNRLTESQYAVERWKSQVQNVQSSCRSCLQRIFPTLTVDSALPHEEWLVQFERQACEEMRRYAAARDEVSELLGQLCAAHSEKDEHKNRVIHYVSVLADTEESLKELQESAKCKETIWKEKLSVQQMELQKVMKEVDALRAEKAKLDTTAQELERIGEGKFKSLQEKLDAAESEKTSFQQKYDEVNKNFVNLKDQIDSKNKEVEDLQKEIASVDRVKKELEDVKTKLEKEKKISKDFSMQMVRLNSLVKIGQDALTAEQENVKKLQSQLQAVQVSTSNGTSSPNAVEVTEAPQSSVQTEKQKKSKKSDGSVQN